MKRKPPMKPGTRVMFKNGRVGTMTRDAGRHNGCYVRMDEKANPFENDEVRVAYCDITPVNDKARAVWEAKWPAFMDRSWTSKIAFVPYNCDRHGHDFSRSKTVQDDAFGHETHRVRFCSWCGEERGA